MGHDYISHNRAGHNFFFCRPRCVPFCGPCRSLGSADGCAHMRTDALPRPHVSRAWAEARAHRCALAIVRSTRHAVGHAGVEPGGSPLLSMLARHRHRRRRGLLLGTGQRHIYARVSTPISVTYAGVLTVCSHVVRLSAPPKLRRCRSTAGSADGDIVTACIFMACAVMAYTVVAYILMAHTVMAAAGSADGM